MIVNRSAEKSGPAVMTIYFRQESADAAASKHKHRRKPVPMSSSVLNMCKAPEAEPDERVAVIEMKGLHSDAILERFMAETGAKPVAPSPAQLEEMEELKRRQTALEDVRESSAAERKRLRDAVVSASEAKALAMGTAA